MSHLVLPKRPTAFRIARLVGLGLAYLSPYAWMAMSPDIYLEGGLPLMPGPFQLLILAAMGYQAFRLVKPWHAGERRAVLHNTNGVVEGSLVFFGLLCIYGSQQFGGSYEAAMIGDALSYGDVGTAVAMLGEIGGDGLLRLAFTAGLPLLGLSLIVGWRSALVIDGAAQRVWSLGKIPRSYAFSDVEGLGIIEVRLIRRGGGYSGSQYWIGLFKGGKATKAYATDSAADAEAKLRQIQQLTGVPIGRAAAGSAASTAQ